MGVAGTGKTFLLRLIAVSQRLTENRYVVIVGSSGLAACMYERGTTAHYQFKVPITDSLDTDLMRNKELNDREFWERITLIIWEKLPMVHKDTLEYVST
jgi:hypothetical protein